MKEKTNSETNKDEHKQNMIHMYTNNHISTINDHIWKKPFVLKSRQTKIHEFEVSQYL